MLFVEIKNLEQLIPDETMKNRRFPDIGLLRTL